MRPKGVLFSKFIFLACVFLWVLNRGSNVDAFAQTNTKASKSKNLNGGNISEISQELRDLLVARSSAFKQSIEKSIESILSSDVFGDSRFVLVQISLNEQAIQNEIRKRSGLKFPGLPNKLSQERMILQFFELMSNTQFKNFLNPILIDITLNESVKKNQRDFAEKALKSNLDLNTGAKVNLKFESIDAQKVQARLEENQSEKLKILAEKDAALRAQDSLSREKESVVGDRRALEVNLKQEQAKTLALQFEIDKLKGNIDELKSKVTQQEQELDVYKTPLGDLKKQIKGLELPLTVLPVFVLLLAALVVTSAVLNATQRKRSTMMKEGVELLASTLGKIGGKVASGKSSTVLGETTAMQKLTENGLTGGRASSSDSSLVGMAGELISQEMIYLKSESESAWTEAKLHPFLTYSLLKDWLADGESDKFMNLAATLSPHESTELIQVFSHQETSSLRGIITDVSSRLKGYSVMLALVRLVQERLREGSPVVRQLDCPALVKSSDDQLAGMLFSKEPKNQAALLSLFSLARLQRLLEKEAEVFGSDAVAVTLRAMAECKPLPDNELKKMVLSFDQELHGLVQNQRESELLNHIEDLALNADKFSPKLKAALSLARAQSQSFARQFDAKSITFDHVLALHPQVILELIDELDAEQIAQLMISLQSAGRNLVVQILNEKTRITAAADFQRFQKSPTGFKTAEVAGLALQSDIVKRLKKMIDSGIVELPKRLSSNLLASDAGLNQNAGKAKRGAS